MISLNATLDNLIAMVVVLLALSLVVQAVQSAVKKGFKLKSRQIEDSLAHLFQLVLHNETNAQGRKLGTQPDAQTPGAQPVTQQSPIDLWAAKWKGFAAVIGQSPFLRLVAKLPILRMILRKVLGHDIYHPAADPDFHHAATLYNEVLNKFCGIGRTALSTRPIFDSLSKNDLLKVVGSIDPTKIDHEFDKKIEHARAQFDKFYALFQEWASWLEGGDFKTVAESLSTDDRAKLADLQAKFKPLLGDIRLLLQGDTSTGAAIGSLANDVVKLRAINLDEVQTILDDVHTNVVKAAERAKLDNKTDVATALNTLAAKLIDISAGFKLFRQKYNAVFAKWVKLEESFDAVMQSFEERYTRGMKTAAIVISFLVVAFLNANFFKVFQDISTSDAKRELIIQSRGDVLDALAKNAVPSTPASANDQAARDKQTQDTVEAWFRASKTEIDRSASTFTGYGFAPITWHDTKKWIRTLDPTVESRNAVGGVVTRSWEWGMWGRDRKHDLKVLLGWIVMALLLSVGAPFWQDFLESLFGVKNVLRKQSATQNVEQAPGAGQTKQG